ncbi:MAG: heavy-metal-associated domain-containing protein [Butyrivibrio sp.]|nr:heavy-metal-associated domain-containing protein [Butyrivibrio sp.]
MATIIVVVILIVIVAFSLRGAMSHMKGEGGCCGGGCDTASAEPDKELEGEILGTKEILIEGMHCDHCANSVKRSLNKLDGVSAKVELSKNKAIVSYTRQVEDDELRLAVERLDYKVVSIN